MCLRPAPLASAALLLLAVAACVAPALSLCSGPKSCYDTAHCITTVKKTVLLRPNDCIGVALFAPGRVHMYGEREPDNVCPGTLVPTGITAVEACELGSLKDELKCKNEHDHIAMTGYPGIIIYRSRNRTSCPPTQGRVEVETCCKFPKLL